MDMAILALATWRMASHAIELFKRILLLMGGQAKEVCAS